MSKSGPTKDKLGKKFIGFFINYRILKTNFQIVIIIIFLLAALHFSLAVAMYSVASQLLERKVEIAESCFSSPCSLKVKIPAHKKDTVYLYIAFEEFYLNHRKVMGAYDIRQFEGKNLTFEQVKASCGEYSTIGDARRFEPAKEAESPGEQPLSICGLFPLLFVQCQLKRQRHCLAAQVRWNHKGKKRERKRLVLVGGKLVRLSVRPAKQDR